MNPLRVAILCSADSYRGSAVSFLHIAQGLSARGLAVRVYTGHESVTQPLTSNGVHVEELDLRSTNLRTALRLRSQLRAFGADVLMVDRPRDLRLGFLATKPSRVSLVYRYNAHGAHPPADVLVRAAYRLKVRETVFLTYERAHRILPQAAWMRRLPHRVIHEGISMEEFYPDRAGAETFRAKYELGDSPFILNVGAFTREKRTELLIDAMHRMSDAPALVLCGDGHLGEQLEERARELRVRVRFIGRMPRGDLRGAYSAATVVAHACPVETFGLTMLEAMACGAPVVGVKSGGLMEVVGQDGSAGLLAPPEDARALAESIAQVLADPKLAARLGAGARVRAESRFTLDRMAKDYERLFRDVCA